jgi:DNA-binding CsgD family transcriptional regulator/PAS domain-containing protein
MAHRLSEELSDAVSRAALEPDAWHEVMGLMSERFPSAAQTFYFLHLEPRRVRPVRLVGIAPRWVDAFDSLYFASDNPWIRMTERLHRPGIVRTNERLDRVLGEDGVLYRSSYYNDWMRPQGFRYTIGCTLLADAGLVANITLLREPDRATFDDDEVADFERLSRMMTRSLQTGVRLERAENDPAGTRALDALPRAVALVEAEQRLVYANPAMDALLRARRGLEVRQGALRATRHEVQSRLAACIDAALSGDVEASPAPGSVLLTPPGHSAQVLHAAPVAGALGRYLPARRMALLMVTGGEADRRASCDELRYLYGFTRAEARLAQSLAGGRGLREAAAELGIAYGTAKVCLKTVFQKAGVHSQAEFVARMLRDTTALN